MAEFLDTIGLVSGLLGIIQFGMDNFPGDTPPQGATVLIKAQNNLNDDDVSPGGEINSVFAFDQNNNYLGQSDGGSTGDGGTFTTTIDQTTAGVQSGFISIDNANDATCIAWVTVNQYDGSPSGSWTGDVGYNCDADWYYQVEVAGKFKDEDGGGDYKPYCTWLDGDHTNDIANAALKFNVYAYGQSAADTVDNNKQCSSTKFGADSGPINDQPDKRSLKPRTARMTDKLITSTWHAHTAAHLCGHAKSWGPDFVGSDGYFCDMETKTLSPLCSTKEVEGCVDVDAEGKKITKRTSVARRTVNTTHRSYKKVVQWE